jgi:undecaprenyl-diphosphatase
MCFADLHGWEISIIQWIQQVRTPLTDDFFYALNLFDGNWIYLIAIYLLASLRKPKLGLHLLYLLTLGNLLHFCLKKLFAQPRPFELVPSLKVLGASGFGFPSGAATSGMILLGFLFLYVRAPKKNALWRSFLLTLLLLAGMTRVYLGAHFPSDILGGYLLGGFLLLIYRSKIDALEKWASSYSSPFLFFLSQGPIWILFALAGILPTLPLVLVLAGFCYAFLFFKPVKRKIFRLPFLPRSPYPTIAAVIGSSSLLTACYLLILMLKSSSLPFSWKLLFIALLSLGVGLWIPLEKRILKTLFPRKF